MRFKLFLIIIIILFILISYKETYKKTYKIYGSNKDSTIYSYIWAYRGNNFPLSQVKQYSQKSNYYGNCSCNNGNVCENNCQYGYPTCSNNKCICGKSVFYGCNNISDTWC